MRKLNMWFDCKYCGKDFQSTTWELYCKDCQPKAIRKPDVPPSTMMMIRNREFIKNYKKDKKCTICGYNKCPSILDFHHLNRKEKNRTVSELMKSLKSIEVIKREIEKCVLVCPNCHREMHMREGHGRA